MVSEKYDKKDLLELIDSAEWQLNEDAINAVRENESSGTFDIGKVYFGNDCFPLAVGSDYDDIKIEYSHRYPKAKYEGEIATAKEFYITVSNMYELYPVFYCDIDYGNDRYIKRNEFAQDFSDLKEKICSILLDDAVINVRDSDKYRAIRDNGNGFFKQVDKAINAYCRRLGQKPKIAPEGLVALARYYDNKVIEALENNRQGKINTVKRMLEDGLKPSQICIIGSNMDSVYTGNPNWPKEILKLPEIQEFQNQLSSKRLNPVCSRTK